MNRNTALGLLLACLSMPALAQDAEPADAARDPDRAAATAGPRGERVAAPSRGAAEPGATVAPASPQAGDAEFERMDTNRDGRLSREELAVFTGERSGYVAVDRDGDGGISRGEFSAFEEISPAP